METPVLYFHAPKETVVDVSNRGDRARFEQILLTVGVVPSARR